VIFDQLAIVNAASAADPSTLHLSFRSQSGVKLGPFSRKGTTPKVDQDAVK
jgi:hypothetical protein